MPLYEYECTSCHRRTEKIQKFSDAELTVCPHCGERLERTLTAPNVQFKGGGWYKDLYSSAKPASGGDTSGGEASGSSAAEGSSGASSSEGSGSGSGSGDGAKSSDSAKPAAAPSAPPAAAPSTSPAAKA